MEPNSSASKTPAPGMPAPKPAPKHSPLARGAALALVILLLALFAATLIVGVFGGPDQSSTLHALIFADVVVPVVIYAWLLFVRQMDRRRSRDQEGPAAGQDTKITK